ncbi:MAG: Dps family protein [Bacteroidota bacterium]
MNPNTLTHNPIGLDLQQANQLADNLQILLADYSVFYLNVRGFHWNIKGDKFFELHAKFEELYNDLQIKIDEVAERILTLGATPLHTYEAYLQDSEVEAVNNVSNGQTAVQNILAAFARLLKRQREILSLSDEAGDEGTNALMSDYIREQEKLSWMYRAYLG